MKKLSEKDVHKMARQLARKCRSIIQGILMEQEWPDVDAEFANVIEEKLKTLTKERAG